MDLNILKYIGVLFAAVSVIGLVFTMFVCSREIKCDYFSMIFTGRSFRKTERDSKAAKKMNSPFIEKNTIIKTVTEGADIVNQKNMFEEVGNCDEKPVY